MQLAEPIEKAKLLISDVNIHPCVSRATGRINYASLLRTASFTRHREETKGS